MLTSDQFARAAQSFAARYSDFNPKRQIECLVERAEELAVGPSQQC